jgi:cbb3-type cytochrome c oxidase subunit III
LSDHKAITRKLLLPFLAILLLLAAGAAWSYRSYTVTSALLRADADAVPAALLPGAINAGKSIFLSDCATCHRDNAKGDKVLGVPDLTDHDWLFGTGLVSDIQKIVRYGIRSQDPRGQNLADMPAFARAIPYPREKEMPPLAPADVRDVVQFILSKQNRASDQEAVARGLKIFTSRGGCWDCHGDNAKGDNASGSPNLTDNVWLYGSGSAADIATSIEKGHQGVMPAFVNRLSAAEILEVSLYVHSLSQPEKTP